MARRNIKNSESPAASLAKTAAQMAKDGYVTAPVRKLFGSRIDQHSSLWKDVYNTMLGGGPEGYANPAATTPIGTEIPVEGGTEGLGYISWGSNNRLPNLIGLLVSMLPYTAVGVKFNTDVIAGLGPRPKYRFNHYVNGSIKTESVDYSAAGKLLQGELFNKRKAMLDLLNSGDDVVKSETRNDLIRQMEDEIKEVETEYKTWQKTNDELLAFMQRSNLDLWMTELANDMCHLGICFPVIQLEKGSKYYEEGYTYQEPTKIIAVKYQSGCTCRLERMDSNNRINYVYVSNQWLSNDINVLASDYTITPVPAISSEKPLHSLRAKTREDRLYSDDQLKKTHFIMPCFYPSLGRPYYPEPAWWSILKGDVYRYCSTIIENRAIAKENSNSAGKIIYIHTEYLTKLFLQENADKSEDRENLRNRIFDDINEFLKDRKNNGQTILSYTFIGSDGKEHDAWRIVDVPINNKTEADANKTELEELSNVIFLALGIHSVLIGNSISASSSGGTQQREMYELKKLMSVPTQRLLLKPLYLVRDYNEWDSHLEWEIGQMTLTTLDRNANGLEETKV
jgi:hypothetical protein